jgi:predicted Zn-dependent peptidase
MVKKTIEKYFSNYKNKEILKTPKFSTNELSSFSIKTRQEKSNKIYFIVIFPALAPKDSIRQRSAIQVLSRIIRRFRLEKELREDRGIVYDFNSAWTAPTFDIGYYYFYCSCEPEKIYQIVDIVLENYLRVKNEPVKKEELTQARDFLNKTISMSFDSLDGALSWVADDFFYFKNFYTPEYHIRERNKLEREDLLKVAQKVFDFKKANFVALGPLEKDKFQSFVKKKVEELQ